MTEKVTIGNCELWHGDCREVLPLLPPVDLVPSDVQAMLEKQGGACAICVLPLTKHHIDHCHTTGKVRGLLCHRCNTRLGGLDDKQWRDAAFRYLGLQA